jgi:hypothetical protein
MPTLLSSKRLESDALEARHLGLEETNVDERRTPVVLPLRFFHAGALDREDGHALAVAAGDLDSGQLAATHQTECTKEKIVRPHHRRLPWTSGSRFS